MNLVFTLDYELFGDGSGDVFDHMISPTEQILDICKQYDIKMTVFFEIVEYVKIKEEWDKGNSMGYKSNPVDAINNQLKRIIHEGHDVQLHIHPQWVNAEYKNNKWVVDLTNWRLGDFNNSNKPEIFELIKLGKQSLEALVRQYNSNYNCIALRAGGYNIMPSGDVYSSMKELGILIDSSVFPGGFESGNLSKYDYRKVSNELDYWWAKSENISESTNLNKNVLEIPIFSSPFERWYKLLNFNLIKSLLSRKQQSVSTLAKEKISQKSLVSKIRYLLGKEFWVWDFCTMPLYMHKRNIRFIQKKLIHKRKYFVLIGHPKSLSNIKRFASFLKFLHKLQNGYIQSSTIKEIYERVSA